MRAIKRIRSMLRTRIRMTRPKDHRPGDGDDAVAVARGGEIVQVEGNADVPIPLPWFTFIELGLLGYGKFEQRG